MVNSQTTQLSFPAQAAESKNIFWWLISACVICGFLHVAMGSDPLVPLLAIIAMAMGIMSITGFGVMNIGAVLVFFIAFRYVGFPLFAKLFFGQALDTNLENPLSAFLAVAIGVFAYFIGFIFINRVDIGLPLLRPVTQHCLLRRISYFSFLIGCVAHLENAFRVNLLTSAWNISNAFMPFLHLALISAAASSISRSKGRRLFDVWTVVVLVLEIIFSFVQNARVMMFEAILALILTDMAFRGKITKKQIAGALIAVLLLVIITPVFLFTRGFRDDLNWKERISFTIKTFAGWKEADVALLEYWHRVSLRRGFDLSYYGKPANLLERVSLVNNTDLFMNGADNIGVLKFEVINQAVEYSLPRFFAPDKPADYSEGDWLHYYYTGEYRYGNFLSSPLIGVGYVSFGWIGVFVFPLFVGTMVFLIVKKATSLDIRSNIWAIFILVSISNAFIEGGMRANVAVILRQLPQEIIVMVLISVFVGVNKVLLFNRDRVFGSGAK